MVPRSTTRLHRWCHHLGIQGLDREAAAAEGEEDEDHVEAEECAEILLRVLTQSEGLLGLAEASEVPARLLEEEASSVGLGSEEEVHEAEVVEAVEPLEADPRALLSILACQENKSVNW